MKPVLRVLVVEDSEFDAQMITSLIRKSGYDVVSERVETAAAMQKEQGFTYTRRRNAARAVFSCIDKSCFGAEHVDVNR